MLVLAYFIVVSMPLLYGQSGALQNGNFHVIVAGILHDTIEDSIAAKKVMAEMITERFGSQVADLVLSVTKTDKSLSWDERKQEALEHIKDYSQESLLIKSADIISNMSETLDDYLRYGEEVFARFNAPKEKVVDHQFKTINIIIDLWPENPLAPDLLRLADGLKSLLETIQF